MSLNPDVQASIKKLRIEVSEADATFDQWIHTGDEFSEPTWLFEICFLQLLAITETLGLPLLRQMIMSEYKRIKGSKDGLASPGMTPDNEPYSPTASLLRSYVRVLESFFPDDEATTVTKDLLNIVRDVHYVITDRSLFGRSPRNENDVHLRIEGILKCVFPDLKHKPTLTKAIKNFQPDTGIPSIGTLIEYKFLADKSETAKIADEVLADTRGYVSTDWRRFLYVIYETKRFRTEKEWNQLLKQSGLSSNTTIIVLSGEPARRRVRKRKPTGTRKRRN